MIDALYFDGRSAAARPVRLRIEDGALVLQEAGAASESGAESRWPLAAVQWPERTRHGQRLIHLRGGGTLRVPDSAAFDAWRGDGGDGAGSWVVRAQQNWRATLAAVLGLVVVAAAGFVWGVPLAARTLVAALPTTVDAEIGDAVLAQIEQRWLRPTALPQARRDAVRHAFVEAVAAAYPAGDAPRWRLYFHAADKRLGANALALPGGAIVITDAMVDALQGADDTLVGVLAHELGHLRQRHGMRALVQVSLVGAAAGVAFGDFSSVLAGVPAVLGQLAYSRDAEREADAEAARVLKAAGRSPKAMLLLFDRLRPQPGEGSALAIAFASHPMDEERKAFFRAAAD